MSKYDIPDLPSDEELGITEEDRERYEERPPGAKPGVGPEAGKEERIAPAAGSVGKMGVVAPAAGPGEGARSRWRGPVTLVLLIGLAALTSSSTGLPRPVPANAGDEVFSSARAMSLLIEIARRPRPSGSPEHARVREYLVERLRGLGLEPEVQTTVSAIQGPDAIRAATVRNVLARMRGTASTGAVLVTAHYDSRELSPGAGDDGSGVVAILEALRALRAGDQLRNDVIVLFTDAEELGLLGARAFVDQHPWIRDVALVLSFEMRGGGGASIMFETNDQNGWVVRALDELDPAPVFATSLGGEVYARMPNDTDFTPFREAGKQGLNFAGIGRPNVYHQATDTPENFSEATLQHHGVRALAALRHFGQADLGEVDGPDVVYFTAPVLGLVVYDARWVLPINGGLLVLLLAAGLLGRRRGARPAGLVTGLGLAVLGGALSYGLALALTRWVPRFHPEGGSLAASLYHSEGWYVLATVAAVFAVVTALHAAARRWLSPLELALGAVLVPFGVAVWAGFAAPLAAMSMQWPVAAALLGALVLALLPARSSGTAGWIVFLLLVVPVFVLLVPLTELLGVSLTFGVLGLVAVLTALTLQLSLPALDALRHPNGWWAPLTGLVAAAGFLWIGVRSARTDVDRPAPSTLIYAYEHGTGSAYWVTDADADLVLDEEAIAWAEERARAPFAATEDLTRFGLPWEAAPVASAPVVSAMPPEVVITGDSVEGNVRRVTLAARSRIGAERLTFTRAPDARVRFLAVDGVQARQPGSVERIEHWGVPDSMVVLELDMPADAPIAVHVLETLFRPEELLGAGAFARPDRLAPDVAAGSDRAVLRYSVAAFADPRHAFMPAAGDPASPDPGDAAAASDSAATGDSAPAGDSAAVRAVPPAADSSPGTVPRPR